MFENPRRGRQARNFTTNVSKILDLKSSSEQIFFRKLSLGAPDITYTYQIKLSLAPLAINDCFVPNITVLDTGILRCAGLVLQDLRLWPS